MAVPTFDRARIEALVERAGEQLDGDWVLMGAAAAVAWFSPARTTADIDLIGLAGTQSERLAVMDFALEVGLPVEAVNSAADFFVRRIPDWRDQLVVLHRGSRATIHRPNATLFLLLKVGRLSETDLDDCRQLLATSETIDRDRVIAALDALLSTHDAALGARRASLRASLSMR
ncbi:MAG TPA: hypothetical protein VGG74_37085 [Kofleriaceae bacterium]